MGCISKLSLSITLTMIGFGTAMGSQISEDPPACDTTTEDAVYAQAREQERIGDHFAAYRIYCSLSLRGDDRAQFKTARYLAAGIGSQVAAHSPWAYVLALLANTAYPESKREKLVLELAGRLDADALAAAQERAISLYGRIGISARKDGSHYLTEQEVLELANRSKKRKFTGSRIAREDAQGMPLSVVE